MRARTTALALLLLLFGCSVGPQIVPAVPVQVTHVNISVHDGGTVKIHEFWIDGRAASRQRTTGNEIESASVEAPVNVGAAPGDGPGLPPDGGIAEALDANLNGEDGGEGLDGEP